MSNFMLHLNADILHTRGKIHVTLCRW